jgi:HEAT repeat protein
MLAMSERAAEDLKKEMERQVSAAKDARDRYLSELADTASTSRGDVSFAIAPAEESSDEEPAMTVLTDKALPAATRVEVIERLAASITRRGDYIEALLAIVQDGDEADDVRVAALNALGSAAFQVVRFRPFEQAYRQALRNLVTDADPRLRETAVGILAVQHDPEVQQILLAGLQGSGPLPVARERAIQLLAEDDHLDNLPWLQELYDSGSDGARQEAVRLMGSYAEATEMLEGVLRDKGEPTEVRQQSAASLRNLAPDRFEAIAKEIATDTTDDPEVRAASLSTLQHLGDTDRVHGDSEFIRSLADVGGDESAPQVAQGARDLIEQANNLVEPA